MDFIAAALARMVGVDLHREFQRIRLRDVQEVHRHARGAYNRRADARHVHQQKHVAGTGHGAHHSNLWFHAGRRPSTFGAPTAPTI